MVSRAIVAGNFCMQHAAMIAVFQTSRFNNTTQAALLSLNSTGPFSA